MFLEGNPNYLELDAICDGLLQTDTKYKLGYDKVRGLTLNDDLIPGGFKEHYDAKLDQFLEREAKNVTFSTISDGLALKDVFDNTSTFRTRTFRKRDMLLPSPAPAVSGPSSILVRGLAADGDLDTNKKYEVHYSMSGLYVNEKKLNKQKTERLAAVLKKAGFELKANDEISFIKSGDSKKLK